MEPLTEMEGSSEIQFQVWGNAEETSLRTIVKQETDTFYRVQEDA